MPIKLYIDLLSQPSRAVYILCLLGKIEHNIQIISFFKGETRTKEFSKININQKVPVIDDDGFLIFESGAILRYLSNCYLPSNNPFFPRDCPIKASKVERSITFYHRCVRPGVFAIWTNFLAKKLKQPLHGLDNQEQIDKMNFLCKELDKYIARNKADFEELDVG